MPDQLPQAPVPQQPRAVQPSDHYRALAAGAHVDGPSGTVAFAVSTDDVDAGAGDLYVALGLAASLQRLGWGVLLWPLERWDSRMPEGVDVVVSMIESFVPGLVPQGTALVAWVRNWTETWARLPHLDQFDAVWTSSSAARDRIAQSYAGDVTVLPIGVDVELFTGERSDGAPIDIVTTVNYWGAERLGIAAIDALAQTRDVVWYGANQDHLAPSEHIDHRGKASFFDLPAVYAASRVVIDDVIPPAQEYANHNSRLFEGLASGALVVTNCAEGLDELGLGDVPTYHDGPSLLQAVGNRDDALTERLRAVVHERHSYTARAATADVTLRRVVGVRRHRDGADRGPALVWATDLREELRRAEHDRDVHLAGVRDINERLVQTTAEVTRYAADAEAARQQVGPITAERDRLAARLDGFTRSRLHRVAERVARLAGRRR